MKHEVHYIILRNRNGNAFNALCAICNLQKTRLPLFTFLKLTIVIEDNRVWYSSEWLMNYGQIHVSWEDSRIVERLHTSNPFIIISVRHYIRCTQAYLLQEILADCI